MFSVRLCQDRFCCFLDNLWFDKLRAGLKKQNKKGERMDNGFNPDVILCGWLGSEYQLTNQRTSFDRLYQKRARPSLTSPDLERPVCVCATGRRLHSGIGVFEHSAHAFSLDTSNVARLH